MTFKDFIYECENYEYSNEYYDIMKESSELELMENYLDNQRFLQESVIPDSISDGYFSESVDNDRIQQIMEAAEEKKKNLFKRIWEKIIKALEVVVSFFKKLFNKNKNKNNKNDKVSLKNDEDDLEYDDFDEDDFTSEKETDNKNTNKQKEVILEISEEEIDNIFKKLGIDGNTIDYKNSFIKSCFNEAIKNNNRNRITPSYKDYEAYIFSSLLKSKTVKPFLFRILLCYYFNNLKGIYFDINKTCLSQNNNEFGFIDQKWCDRLNKHLDERHIMSIEIMADVYKLESTVLIDLENLDKIIKGLEKSIKTANDNMKIIIDAAMEEEISDLNKIFNQIMKITGNTMKIYSEFDSFMTSSIPVIREFLKAKNYI